jgi:hypothetical protein
VTAFDIARHDGPGSSRPADGDVHIRCRPGFVCVDRSALPGHTYRYTAVAVDEWAASAEAETPPVRVPPRS